MVGLRVFDVGGLIVWLVWFFRQQDEDDDEASGRGDEPPHADAPSPPPDPSGAPAPWPTRRRDHGDRRPLRPRRRVRESAEPERERTPAG